jgi:hypothetical protein
MSRKHHCQSRPVFSKPALQNRLFDTDFSTLASQPQFFSLSFSAPVFQSWRLKASFHDRLCASANSGSGI